VSSPRTRLAPVAAGWAAAVAGVAIAGGLGSDTSSDWYRDLHKRSWQPPGAVFGPVWTVLCD
jgi:tryptophan-rich sensory protein